MVLLTKTDLVSTDQRASVVEFLRNAAPGALVISKTAAQVTVDVLLGMQVGGAERKPPAAGQVPPAHDLFRSWKVVEAAPLTQSGFRALLNALPPDTVRGKGHVHLAEFPSTRFLFQMVGKRASVIPSGDWGPTAPQTELVFIALRSHAAQPGADYSLT